MAMKGVTELGIRTHDVDEETRNETESPPNISFKAFMSSQSAADNDPWGE